MQDHLYNEYSGFHQSRPLWKCEEWTLAWLGHSIPPSHQVARSVGDWGWPSKSDSNSDLGFGLGLTRTSIGHKAELINARRVACVPRKIVECEYRGKKLFGGVSGPRRGSSLEPWHIQYSTVRLLLLYRINVEAHLHTYIETKHFGFDLFFFIPGIIGGVSFDAIMYTPEFFAIRVPFWIRHARHARHTPLLHASSHALPRTHYSLYITLVKEEQRDVVR